MSAARWVPYAVVYLLAGLLVVHAGSRPEERAIIRRLLDMPVEATWAQAPTSESAQAASPAASGSPEELLAYWSQQHRQGISEPSEEIRRRLLDAATENPGKLPGVLELLPQRAETHDRIKDLYDEAPGEAWFNELWEKAVHDWLMLNGRHLRDDLVRTARSASDNRHGWVENEEALIALTRLDWETARPVLEDHVSSAPSRVATFCLSLLYQHALDTGDDEKARELRERLQAVASDRTATGYSRNRAVEALLSSEWHGRDGWYVRIFGDPTLRNVNDGFYMWSPLAVPVERDPDEWIPQIAALVGNENREIHDNAVDVLVRFHSRRARADALRPLLPWLMDPQWSSARDRMRLIQSVDRVGLTEAIPGLIRVVEAEQGEMRGYAVDSLGSLKAKEAVPALRRALEQSNDPHHRYLIIKALLACGGVSEAEMVEAIEAYAIQLSTPEGREALDEQAFGGSDLVDTRVKVGAMLSRDTFDPPAGLAARLVQRLPRLESERPEAASIVRRIVALWPSAAVDRAFVRDLTEGRAGADAIAAALERRDGARSHIGTELAALVNRGGLAAGVAAVIQGDPVTEQRVLAGESRTGKMALLACARLAGDPLPLPEVGRLLDHPDSLVGIAAERYLEARDCPQARRLILERHPGEARILGARMSFDPGHDTYGPFDRIEQELRRDVLVGGSEEVYALLSAGYWRGLGQRIIRIRDGQAKFSVHTDPARYRERLLSQGELSRLRAFLTDYSFEDLGPLDHRVNDGTQFEYVHLTRDGGRRVFMNNPDAAGGSPYDLLTELFMNFDDAAPLRVHYHVADRIDGLEVVLTEPEAEVQALCGAGSSLFVLVNERGGGDATWRRLHGSSLGPAATTPGTCEGYGANSLPESAAIEGLETVRNAWQVVSLDSPVLVGNRERPGLWRWDGAGEPVRLVDGWFGEAVSTLDGQWVVAARADHGASWEVPNPVVRVRVRTAKEYVLDVPPADGFAPVAYLPERRRVLLRRLADPHIHGRERPVGPEKPEYYLLDPEDGTTTAVTGEFAPYEQETFRALQTAAGTTGKNRVWVAMPDYERNSTLVGLYDPRTFVLEPRVTYPAITFESVAMWVDESAKVASVIYGGHLLRLPLDVGAIRGAVGVRRNDIPSRRAHD